MSKIHENPEFPEFIKSLLSLCELGDKYIQLLLDEYGLEEYTRSFTHKSINPLINYEFYEILGDATTNYISVQYYHKRFIHLFENAGEGNMGPVGIMARLKMNAVSKRSYSGFAENLGFWKYIRVSEEEAKGRTKLLEDVFESFVGCTEYLINKKIDEFCGLPPVYYFMEKIMNKVEINIDRESLYDDKSKLNEDILRFKKVIYLEYKSEDNFESNPELKESKEGASRRWTARAIVKDSKTKKVLYTSTVGYGYKRAEAEQASARNLRRSKILDKIQANYRF